MAQLGKQFFPVWSVIKNSQSPQPLLRPTGPNGPCPNEVGRTTGRETSPFRCTPVFAARTFPRQPNPRRGAEHGEAADRAELFFYWPRQGGATAKPFMPGPSHHPPMTKGMARASS